jgi:hypothetical protein
MKIKALKEFTPIPFWFWNDELTEDEILRQMKEMKDKGVDGFVIHPRKGLPSSIAYLSDEYFHYVKFAVKIAKEKDMQVVLYDEAMYPSGSAHGEVVKADASLASQGLKRIRKEDFCNEGEKIIAETTESGHQFVYALVPSGGTIRGVHPLEDDGEENAPKSADLLNPRAVAKFIELTHEKYYSELSEYFGDTIIAFFTDEPNILGRNAREDIIPWSDGLLDEFTAASGSEEDLHYLFDDTISDASATARRIYKQVVHNRLANSYYKQLSDWCISHKIKLTGHPEKSTDIGYLKYFQIPCQDIVWRFVEPEDGHAIEGEHSTMGKCSSDSARHRGKRRNGNECFGCCGERQNPKLFTEKDMRWYLNWLFVRGVNLVYPHAFYYSTREDRGDERPPEVGLNNPFWPEYHKMSNFIKRMCYLNTDFVNCAQVAILCGQDTLSWKLAKPLFTNQIEFNYLEADLLDECKIADGKLCIAAQKYSVLLAEADEYSALDESGKKVIEEFEQYGGRVIIGQDQEILKLVNDCVHRELVFSGDIYDLRCSHIVKDEMNLVMLVNEGLEPITVKWEDGEYKGVSLWNPYTLESIAATGSMTIEPCDLWVMELEEKF